MTNEEAINYLHECSEAIGDTEHHTLSYAKEALNMAIKALEQEPKTGHWIMHIDDLFPAESTMECNKCHERQPITIDDNYCPNCGAKMEE